MELIQSKVKCNTVKKRIRRDFEFGYIPEDLFVSYNPETGEYVKKVTNYDLKIKVNVNSNYEKSYQIGSFIRTIVSLLTKIDPNKIMIIIDLSSYNDSKNINIKKIIDQLIYVSTSSVILTNVFLVLPNIILNNKLYKKQQRENILANGVTIIGSEYLSNVLNKYTEFNISYKNNNHNIYHNFDSTKNYLSFEFEENIFTNMYTPSIYQLASYSNINIPLIKSNKNQIYIMCIEKISNIHRIHQLMEYYNIDNIIVCLPDQSQSNYEGIVNYCNEYKIKYYDINNILNIIGKSNKKNILAVDIHKDAISLEYGKELKELDDSIIVFGYELSGIPKVLLELATKFIQIESRKSINVVAVLSIILSHLYN